jgi:hypothetical protein
LEVSTKVVPNSESNDVSISVEVDIVSVKPILGRNVVVCSITLEIVEEL